MPYCTRVSNHTISKQVVMIKFLLSYLLLVMRMSVGVEGAGVKRRIKC